MASFSMSKEFEVKELVESPIIARLRGFADEGKVDAFSIKLRHPRFKGRFTEPHFYAIFSLDGRRYGEDAESLEGLNAVLERDYLIELVQEPLEAADQETERERRMHQALKNAWQYVNRPFISASARNEVGAFANAEFVEGQGLKMMFALQTAWTFVHGSGNQELLSELRSLLKHGAAFENLPEEIPEPTAGTASRPRM